MKTSLFLEIIFRLTGSLLATGQIIGSIWFLQTDAWVTIFPGLLLGLLAAFIYKKPNPAVSLVIVVTMFGACIALFTYIIPFWLEGAEADVKGLFLSEFLLISYFLAHIFRPRNK